MILEKGETELQVFLDSLLVIKWMTSLPRMDNIILQPILEQLKRIAQSFIEISYYHVYKDLNTEADALSNEDLLLEPMIDILMEESDGFIHLDRTLVRSNNLCFGILFTKLCHSSCKGSSTSFFFN